eukprot:TRINITY_DN2618_c6_g1_i1.p1 TRINITY_DN2618_c6_g1~~TRINITY_DN2618_c6_g1_i1.p1  ORF type:complete len:520 (+),score=90.68 TRINITY_DN2618_c6_g1_i1:68-1561(+)
MTALFWRISLLVTQLLLIGPSCFTFAEKVAESSCSAGDEACAAVQVGSKAKSFWDEVKKRGLKLKIRKKIVEEKAQRGRPARNRTAMVLSDDVFYGRPIMKIPRAALLSIETATHEKKLREQLEKFLFEDRSKKSISKKFNITHEEPKHLLSLAYPLIAEKRNPDSVFREWLDAAADEKLFALELSPRQRKVLIGTTVEGSYDEMAANRDFIIDSASNLTFFKKQPVTVEEATWAVAVIMRHSRIVHPHQDVREDRMPRMYIFPLVELLDVAMHPDSGTAITFQEEIIVEDHKEEEMVLQIARRDMPKGEEVFVWPGRLSNSEMTLRHGFGFPLNAIGIGRNITVPPGWSDDKENRYRQEYALYNCSSLEAFELRFSEKGYPMRAFVRCFRVSWFLANGWYSPSFKNRIHELNKWPPPKKYTKEDWLSWTQADAEVNRHILQYCKDMRQQLKDSMDSETAEDFRRSTDPIDKVLWHMRGEETRTFKACINIHKDIAT